MRTVKGVEKIERVIGKKRIERVRGFEEAIGEIRLTW